MTVWEPLFWRRFLWRAPRDTISAMRSSYITIAVGVLSCTSFLLAGDKPKEGGKRWSGEGISWELPEGWKLDEKPVAMRFATINIAAEPKPLQLTVTRFPGDVGGTLANVNRWRMQIGLP